MFQGCCIKVFSPKQERPALSSAEAELCATTENLKELVSLVMLLESIIDGIPLTILGTPECKTGTYQLFLRNDATAAISISSMEGLLRCVRHIELRARYIQMLVKHRRLILEQIPGLENPSDGLTKSFKTRELLINLEREVGLVYGLDTKHVVMATATIIFVAVAIRRRGQPDECRIARIAQRILIFDIFHDTNCSTKALC